MKYAALILALMLLSGCAKPMPAAEMRAKIDECEKAGLRYVPIREVLLNDDIITIDIACEVP